jgi:hypothetical protein
MTIDMADMARSAWSAHVRTYRRREVSPARVGGAATRSERQMAQAARETIFEAASKELHSLGITGVHTTVRS